MGERGFQLRPGKVKGGIDKYNKRSRLGSPYSCCIATGYATHPTTPNTNTVAVQNSTTSCTMFSCSHSLLAGCACMVLVSLPANAQVPPLRYGDGLLNSFPRRRLQCHRVDAAKYPRDQDVRGASLPLSARNSKTNRLINLVILRSTLCSNLTIYPAIYLNQEDPNDEAWTRQVDNITFALDAYGTEHVSGITVGNEYILDGGSTSTLLSYVDKMKDIVSQKGWNLTVGTADAGSVMSKYSARRDERYLLDIFTYSRMHTPPRSGEDRGRSRLPNGQRPRLVRRYTSRGRPRLDLGIVRLSLCSLALFDSSALHLSGSLVRCASKADISPFRDSRQL